MAANAFGMQSPGNEHPHLWKHWIGSTKLFPHNMKITKIYTGDLGDSFFQDVEIPLVEQGAIGFLSENIAVTNLQIRKVRADYDYDFHCAPQRQYIVLLDGGVEIETSRGEQRKFQAGEILLVEDTFGKGHRTKNLQKRERTSLFIHI